MSSNTTTITKRKKSRNDKFDDYIGPTDPKIDSYARSALVDARIKLLFSHAFFGNLSTRMKLVNADDWCSTAATDGINFYYNSRFIKALRKREVEFLVAHEVLHCAYDHMGRRDDRDPQIFNIANDYAVNADLKKHKVGEFITTVPCLYDEKYIGKSSEQIYDDLMKNVTKINMDDLIDMLIDEHMNQNNDEKDSEKSGRPNYSKEELERIRQEVKQSVISAAQASANSGSIPAGIQRLISDITNPTLPWKELIQTNLISNINNDYSWKRPSRRGWHMDAIMPGMTPGDQIDVDIAIDMSGSITQKQASHFLSEIKSIMETFESYKLHVFCFDTEVYNPADFDSDSLQSIHEYKPVGGGGTDFNSIFNYLRNNDRNPKSLIVFTDGMPFGSWGDKDYTEVIWVIHGSRSIVPPWGTWAYFD